MVSAAQSAQIWQASLDDVRASFNPLFAASRQYEQQLARISTAEEMGAINAREAAAARVAAAGSLAPAASGLGGKGRSAVGNNFYSANIAAQGFDIGVTSAMGMNPLTIGLQQGSQLVGVMQQMGGGATAIKAIGTGLLSIISPASLATIALVTLGAAGIQWLMGLKKETKSFGDNVDDLTATLGRMKTNLDLVQNIRLGDAFGSLTADVKGLAQGMLELDRASELKQLNGVIDSFLNKEVKESWAQQIGRSFAVGVVTPGTDISPEAGKRANYNKLGAANSADDFFTRIDELKKLSDSGDVEGVTAKILALQNAMSGGGSVNGMKDELKQLLLEISKTAIESAKVEAAWNGSAKDKVLTRQTDQMVLAYKQQAELAATETQFGKASLQVDQLRNVQAREMLDVRLAEQGILAGSANWHRIMAALAAQELATATQIGDEKRRQVDAVALGYRQEAALSAAGRQFGQDSFQVERIRARQAKEALDLRLEEMGVIKGSVGWQKAHNALLDQQLQRELDIVAAKKEAVRDQLDRLNGIRREIALIGASNAEQARANALAEADIEIRKRKLTGLEAVLERIRAIARANAETERDRQKALADIANQSAGDGYDAQIAAEPNPILRATLAAEKEYARQIADGADASVAAASAERVRARAMQELTQSQQDYLRDQATRLQQMQLELALIGQTAAVRARVLALVQAERDIQRLGATGDIAQTMRRNAVLEAEGTQFIERQADAWKRVQSAGESAIDSVLDKLKAGDVAGRLPTSSARSKKASLILLCVTP